MKNHSEKFAFRKIQPEDVQQVAKLSRTVMTEYQCVGEGYSIMGPEVDDMYSHYNNELSEFYVIYSLENKSILGCGGIAPLKGGNEETCELRKMYFYAKMHYSSTKLIFRIIYIRNIPEFKFSIIDHRKFEASGFFFINNSINGVVPRVVVTITPYL